MQATSRADYARPVPGSAAVQAVRGAWDRQKRDDDHWGQRAPDVVLPRVRARLADHTRRAEIGRAAR
jgi:hypothetical protein